MWLHEIIREFVELSCERRKIYVNPEFYNCTTLCNRTFSEEKTNLCLIKEKIKFM